MIHVLRYTEELEKVGFSTEQAKKSVQIWMDLMDQNFATKADFREYYLMSKNDLKEQRTEFKSDLKDLQTEFKSDLKDLQTEFKSDLKDLRNEVKNDMKDLEHRLTVRLGIMLASSIGIISALITFKH